MKELMHSVRAQLIAGYVAALLLLGVTAIGAATGASTVSHEFVQAVRTDDVLTDIILLRTKLVDDEETALRGYLLTHDTSFLVRAISCVESHQALRRDADGRAVATLGGAGRAGACRGPDPGAGAGPRYHGSLRARARPSGRLSRRRGGLMNLSITAIIVLTACGASDYISKPVDVGQLFALLRVWLDRAAPR